MEDSAWILCGLLADGGGKSAHRDTTGNRKEQPLALSLTLLGHLKILTEGWNRTEGELHVIIWTNDL